MDDMIELRGFEEPNKSSLLLFLAYFINYFREERCQKGSEE